MDIKKYTSYFHDGSLFEIAYRDREIELFIESAEVSPDDFDEEMSLSMLSTFPTIRGKIILQGVKKTLYNHHSFSIASLQLPQEGVEIFHLSIEEHRVELQLFFPSKTTFKRNLLFSKLRQKPLLGSCVLEPNSCLLLSYAAFQLTVYCTLANFYAHYFYF